MQCQGQATLLLVIRRPRSTPPYNCTHTLASHPDEGVAVGVQLDVDVVLQGGSTERTVPVHRS
jgi:hypothetical protein